MLIEDYLGGLVHFKSIEDLLDLLGQGGVGGVINPVFTWNIQQKMVDKKTKFRPEKMIGSRTIWGAEKISIPDPA